IYMIPFQPISTNTIENNLGEEGTGYYKNAFCYLYDALEKENEKDEKRTILALLQKKAIDDFVKEDTSKKGLDYLKNGLQYAEEDFQYLQKLQAIPKEGDKKIEEIITPLEVHFIKLLDYAYNKDKDQLKAALEKAYAERDKNKGSKPDPQEQDDKNDGSDTLKYIGGAVASLFIVGIIYKIVTHKKATTNESSSEKME
ncbi:MAG: hypothetical protein AAF335_04520, partial [Bacteroidota bacterium]